MENAPQYKNLEDFFGEFPRKTHRLCIDCGEEFEAMGRRKICGECRRIKARAKERRKELRRKEANPEKYLEKRREVARRWRMANPEKCREVERRKRFRQK